MPQTFFVLERYFYMVILTENRIELTQFLSAHAMQLFMGAIFIYYAVKLLVFKDVDAVRPKEWGKLKEENVEPYAKEMGILILCFAACVFVMEVVSQYDGLMGMLFLLLSIAVVFFRFKKIEEKYGNKNRTGM